MSRGEHGRRMSFLFDIDGTLVDSRDVVEAAWSHVASIYGVDGVAVVAACHGRRATELAGEFFPGWEPGEVAAHVTRLEQETADRVIALPGAAELLARLEVGRWAAVTSGPRDTMVRRLVAAGLPVPDVLVAAEDVTRGKPDPEGFAVAAAAIGAEPATCVVVEDAPAGVAAGRAFGARVIAVVGTHTVDELKNAERVVGSLHEVAAALDDCDALRRVG